MKKSDPEIRIEIYKAKPISFQVNREKKSDEELNLDGLSLSLVTEFGLDEKKSIVGIELTIQAVTKDENEEIFELISFFEFGVFDLKNVLLKKDDKTILEPDFAKKLLNISIGGSRGMLSVLLSSTPYHNFTLPIANLPDEIFNGK